jgi:hypothetical protein
LRIFHEGYSTICAHKAYRVLRLTIEAFIARLQTAQVPDLLSCAQKRNWVKNLLADLSSRNLIAPERKGPSVRWRLVPQK